MIVSLVIDNMGRIIFDTLNLFLSAASDGTILWARLFDKLR